MIRVLRCVDYYRVLPRKLTKVLSKQVMDLFGKGAKEHPYTVEIPTRNKFRHLDINFSRNDECNCW